MDIDTPDTESRRAERESRRLRNARARDRLERMREERRLRHWLLEVWDAPASPALFTHAKETCNE